MATVGLFNDWTFLDSATGHVVALPGVQVHFYNPGTTVYATRYDQNGNNPTSGVFTLDASGNYDLYAVPGPYDISINGVTHRVEVKGSVGQLLTGGNKWTGVQDFVGGRPWYALEALASGGNGTPGNPWSGWESAFGALAGGVYRASAGDFAVASKASLKSRTVLDAYGALFKAPASSAFNIFAAEGTSGGHLVDVVVRGASVDMQGTEETVDANGVYLLYADRGRVIDFSAYNCEFEGVLARRTQDLWIVRFYGEGMHGDAIHLEDAIDWIIDSPIIVGAGQEAGIGTTGATTEKGQIITPDIRGHDIGIGISGGHDITTRGGFLHDLVIAIKVEEASGYESYDITFDGTKVSDIDQTNGFAVAITRPNRTNNTHPVRFCGHGEIDAGARPAFSINGAGDVVIEDYTIRTTSWGIDCLGDASFPGGNIYVRRCKFIGCSIVFRRGSGANSGQVFYEDCEFVSCAAISDDPTWPVNTKDSGWKTITPGVGWAASTPPPRYRKVDGVVYVEGLVSNTSGAGNSSAVATLPVGYRPAVQQIASSYQQVQVSAAGVIAPFGTIPAGDGLGLYLSYPVD